MGHGIGVSKVTHFPKFQAVKSKSGNFDHAQKETTNFNEIKTGNLIALPGKCKLIRR